MAQSPLRPSNIRVQDDDDLLLVRLLMGAQPTLLIVAAAEAHIFDCLGESERAATEVADLLRLDLRATRLVLDGLVGLGLLDKVGDRYSNSPTAYRHLRVETDDSQAVRLWISGTRQWEKLPEILKTGQLPNVRGETQPWRRDRKETTHSFEPCMT